MSATQSGSIHLFRVAGIDLFLHWSWFLVAMYQISYRAGQYGSIVWNVLEYLALFLIVLLHEFGHALACRQVGGRANRILLWPLGGVAYVNPPPRPGATLWSLAAGPLVNVALFPLLTGAILLEESLGGLPPDVRRFIQVLWLVNVVLLVFNMLPIYPLDGGQILHALLWYIVGRARSLMVTVLIGFVGVAGLVLLAIWARSIWMGILSGFILLNCWGGLRRARGLVRLAKAPRHQNLACPSCGASPPNGRFWVCGHCQNPFDFFEEQGVCTHCNSRFGGTHCLECGEFHPAPAWLLAKIPPGG